ncbi:MAG: glycosyltransferase involved in cell wall biosynthesis [Planctomycetota bacterium]
MGLSLVPKRDAAINTAKGTELMSERLRIVRALPFFGAQFGGPVAQARIVNRELVARGHDVRLISSDLGQPPEVPRNTWHERDGVRYLFAKASGLSCVPPYIAPRTARRELRAALADADIATINCGLSLWGKAVMSAARAAAVPFVYNAEGALDPVRLAEKRWQKKLFVSYCERAVLRQAAALQAVTEYEVGTLAALGAAPGRIHIVPNGVEVPPVATEQQRLAGRQLLGIAPSATVVLFFGRVNMLKGIDLLLAAAGPLMRTRPDVHIAIVGPDEGAVHGLRQQAQTLQIEERVHFHPGIADDAARADVLAAADVFALTSRSEGLPNAALEAAAAGLPLLLTTACHLPEVSQANAGAVGGQDVASIAAALDRLLGDRDYRLRCADNARAMASKRFGIAIVVDRLVQLYSDLAKRS